MFIPDPRWEEPNLLIPGKKPTGPVVIDWSHPLARGLTHCFVGNSQAPQDLARSALIGARSSPVFGFGDPSYPESQQTWYFDGTDDAFILSSEFSNSTGDLSCFAITKWTANFGVMQIAAADSFSAGNRSFQFRIEGTNPKDIRLIIFSSGTDYQVVTTGAPFPLRETVSVGFSHSSASGQGIYLNGGSVASGSNTVAIDSDPAELNIGGRYDYGAIDDSLYGSIGVVYLWDRPLSAAEHAEISRNPYQFLIPA